MFYFYTWRANKSTEVLFGETKHRHKEGTPVSVWDTACLAAQTGIYDMWVVQKKQQEKVKTCCGPLTNIYCLLGQQEECRGSSLSEVAYPPPSSFPSVCVRQLFPRSVWGRCGLSFCQIKGPLSCSSFKCHTLCFCWGGVQNACDLSLDSLSSISARNQGGKRPKRGSGGGKEQGYTGEEWGRRLS